MEIIELNESHRLSSDSRQWKLEKKNTNTNTGEVTWSQIRYYTTLDGAVNACHGYFLRISDAMEINELIAESKRITDDLVKALKPKIELS